MGESHVRARTLKQNDLQMREDERALEKVKSGWNLTQLRRVKKFAEAPPKRVIPQTRSPDQIQLTKGAVASGFAFQQVVINRDQIVSTIELDQPEHSSFSLSCRATCADIHRTRALVTLIFFLLHSASGERYVFSLCSNSKSLIFFSLDASSSLQWLVISESRYSDPVISEYDVESQALFDETLCSRWLGFYISSTVRRRIQAIRSASDTVTQPGFQHALPIHFRRLWLIPQVLT